MFAREISRMLFGIGDKPIGLSKALLLPAQQAFAPAGNRRKLLAFKNLLIKSTDQGIKDQGYAFAPGPAAGRSNIPLTKAWYPDQIYASKTSEAGLQIGGLREPWLKGANIPAQLSKAAHQRAITGIVRAVVAEAPPPKNRPHLG